MKGEILTAATFAALALAQPAAAQGDCPPMYAPTFATHTRPPTGDELLHQGEYRTVLLKAVIRPDGTAEIGVWRSSGLTVLNERAVSWVRDHWRWPKGCAPGTTRRISIGFSGW